MHTPLPCRPLRAQSPPSFALENTPLGAIPCQSHFFSTLACQGQGGKGVARLGYLFPHAWDVIFLMFATSHHSFAQTASLVFGCNFDVNTLADEGSGIEVLLKFFVPAYTALA